MTVKRLIFLGLYVADIEKSARFYKDAFGLELSIGENPGGDPWVGGIHAETSWREGAYLHFALLPAKEGSSRAHITLTVDDLDRAHEQATSAGAEVLHEPRQEAWGRAGRYLDLDGNIVTLMQQ